MEDKVHISVNFQLASYDPAPIITLRVKKLKTGK